MPEPSPATSTQSGEVRALSIHRDHHIGCLYHHGHLVLGLDAEFIDRLVGDRGGHDLAAADVDADMRGGRALLDFEDGALDLVTCTDAHDGSHKVRRCAAMPRSCRQMVNLKNRDRRPQNIASAYG